MDARTVSIWTTAGRLGGIPFRCSETQFVTLSTYRRGESDLVCRDGKWFLFGTVDIPDVEVKEPTRFLGVDLGIANIATDSDGGRHSGKGLNRVRHRNRVLRAKLQRIGTRSAKRLLKRRARKEARFAADTNHVISKQIVTEAKRTSRGIALEDLSGIRQRVRLRKPQRVTLHSWAFAQLASFLAYKARRVGVALSTLIRRTPRKAVRRVGTSAERTDRPSTFCCTSCGFAEHADVNAARNVASRGVSGWAEVMQPNAARGSHPAAMRQQTQSFRAGS